VLLYRAFLMFAVLAFLPGCKSSTGLEELPLAGTWTYSVTGLKFSDGATCSLTDITLTIHQRGDLFTGFASGGTGSCNGSPPTPLRDMTVNEGRFNPEGGAVIFKVTGDLNNLGRLSGRTITGTTTSRNLLNTGPGTGTFTMTRQ
jgi:hypothetical protein